ncbi:MAG: DsbC family protein [Azoarcus sp.]|jgi:thiol:disulfide interchange protein DsbC|nr:DsbC family protein [Azoarcus sp.]
MKSFSIFSLEAAMPCLFRLPFFTGLLLAFAAAPALADEAAVRKGFEAFANVPEPIVESVTRIPQGGLYEVLLVNGSLYYTDKAVSFILDGSIIDTKTRRNLTLMRLEKLAAIDFKTLPLGQAVKRVNGNGKRVLATFEDPHCGFCKKLGQELQKVKNVTIYTFLYPILSPDSESISRHIWCAKNKATAWVDWVVENKMPQAANCDSAAIDRNMALGKRLRITGTPTLFFADGSRASGYIDANGLETVLEAGGLKTNE